MSASTGREVTFVSCSIVPSSSVRIALSPAFICVGALSAKLYEPSPDTAAVSEEPSPSFRVTVEPAIGIPRRDFTVPLSHVRSSTAPDGTNWLYAMRNPEEFQT